MSQGKGYVIENTSEYLKFLIYDFDIGSYHLKPLHKSWLDKYIIAPSQYKSVQLMYTGYASKGGAAEFNQHLAYLRASSANNYVANRARIPVDSTTLDDPLLQDDDDPLQQDGWRAVLVQVWYN